MNFKVMVINLDASTERWESITNQCKHVDLKPHRVSGSNGRLLVEKDKNEVYDRATNLEKYDKILNNGEIACYLSHIKCWQKIIEQSLDFALILEDDAVLTSDLMKYINKLGPSHKQWDYIKLSNGRKAKPSLDTLPLGQGLNLCRSLKMPSTTTGQLVSLSGAKRLLAKAYPIARPVDVDIQYWFEKSLRCFVTYPLPVLNGNFDSEINTTSHRKEVRKRPFKRMYQKFMYEACLLRNYKRLPVFPNIPN